MVEDKQIEEITTLKDDWYKKEFSTINTGDKRLDKRAIKVASDLSNQLSAPINQASKDWNATKAAYNFFDNDKGAPRGAILLVAASATGKVLTRHISYPVLGVL